MKSSWICENGIPALGNYDWKDNKFILKEDRLVRVCFQVLAFGRPRRQDLNLYC